MRLRVRLSGGVVRWLGEHPEEAGAFFERLAVVRSNELALLRNAEATMHPDSRYMCRSFRFGTRFRAVAEWFPHEQRIRVVVCRELKERPNRESAS